MGLTKRDIAQAGLRVLNVVGLEGLTVRAIADELGVKAPALYWHLKNKQALLDEVATQMYLTHVRPLPRARPSDDWRARLVRLARDVRRMMLAYRDGAKVFSGTFFMDDSGALPGESMIEEIAAAGYTPAQALRVVSTVLGYTVGFTIEQQAVEPLPGMRDPRYDDASARMQRSAVSKAVIELALHGNFDRQYDDGLRLVMLGASAWLRPVRRRASRRTR